MNRRRSIRAPISGRLSLLLVSLLWSCGGSVTGPESTAPTITAVSPNPIPGTTGLHTVTITGTNFVDKPTVIATWGAAGGGSGPVNPSRVSFVNSTQLTIILSIGVAPDTGSLRVVNSNNQSSQPWRYSISAP